MIDEHEVDNFDVGRKSFYYYYSFAIYIKGSGPAYKVGSCILKIVLYNYGLITQTVTEA